MNEPTTRHDDFWRDLERRVTSKTGVVLQASKQVREPVIAYLREVEAMARIECNRRETIQVIASARRLLGDRKAIGPVDGPFAHSMGAVQ